MKRNQKLMFDMLRHVEDKIPESEYQSYSGEDTAFHGGLLVSAGMLKEETHESFSAYFWKSPKMCSLTNKGYDQIDLIRRKQKEFGPNHSSSNQVDVPWDV